MTHTRDLPSAVRERDPSRSSDVGQVRTYADLAVRRGWLLPADRDQVVAAAKAAPHWS